jgi:hypothetical protein
VIAKRLHFDLQGAADYLGVSLGYVEYYIKEGDLRYGIEKFYFSKMKLLPLKRLDATQQQSIVDRKGAYYQTAKGSPVTLTEAVLDAMEPLTTPDNLYFKHTAIKDCYWFEGGHEAGHIYAQVLEDLDGSLVSLWLPSDETANDWFAAICPVGKFADWNHRYDNYDVNQPLYPCVITRDDLDRLKGKESTETDLPFKLPKVTNEIAEAMCEYGNRYFLENNKVPNAMELRAYILKYSAQDLQLTFDARDKQFSFGGKPLSERQFKQRMQDYLR